MSASGTSRKKYVKQGKSGLRGYADSARWRDCRTAEHAREGLVRHLRGIDPAFEVDLPLLLDFLGLAAPHRYCRI
jgi:hypothetical protein